MSDKEVGENSKGRYQWAGQGVAGIMRAQEGSPIREQGVSEEATGVGTEGENLTEEKGEEKWETLVCK